MDGGISNNAAETVLTDAVEPVSAPWESYWPTPPLAPGEVHVLRVSLPQESRILSHLESALSEGEMERASAFHFPEDRERYVVARGALRVVLGGHLGASPRDLRLDVNEFGKPMLEDPPAPNTVDFNVSHSGAFVLLALARDLRVGIDIEQIREDVPHVTMASRFFSTEEHEALTAQPAPQRLTFFFQTWTHKEAYVKGRGLGLSIPPQDFSVRLGGPQAGPVDDRACSASPGAWRVREIEVARGYVASLAAEGSDWAARCFDADEVLRVAAET